MDRQRLIQYRYIILEVRRLQSRRASLCAKAIGAVQTDRQPGGSGPGDPTGSLAAAISELDAQLAEETEKLLREAADIERAVASLRISDEREVLRLRYLEGNSWKKIATKMHYNVRWLYRIHDRALRHLSGE